MVSKECANCHKEYLEPRSEDDNYECPACGRIREVHFAEKQWGEVIEEGDPEMAYNPEEDEVKA